VKRYDAAAAPAAPSAAAAAQMVPVL